MIEFFFGIAVTVFIFWLLFETIKRKKEKNMRKEHIISEWIENYADIRNCIGEKNTEEKISSDETLSLFASRNEANKEK